MAEDKGGRSLIPSTSYRIDPKLKEEFQIACIRRHVSDTKAIEEAIQAWIAARPELPQAAAPADVPFVAALPRFLREADPGAIGYFKQLLQSFLSYEYRKSRPKKQEPDPQPPTGGQKR